MGIPSGRAWTLEAVEKKSTPGMENLDQVHTCATPHLPIGCPLLPSVSCFPMCPTKALNFVLH